MTQHLPHDPCERMGFTPGGDSPAHPWQVDQAPRLPRRVDRREGFPESNSQEDQRDGQPRRAGLDTVGPCRRIARETSAPGRTRNRTILTPLPMD
jgi:hypothetical protein